MKETTFSVIPVQGGWAVENEFGGEATMFLRGARAEAHARRLGQASWDTGTPATVLVHSLDGQLIGRWDYSAATRGHPSAFIAS